MSDRPASDEREREWLTGLLDDPESAVRALDREAPALDGEERAAYLEILGMLPLALEEGTPSAELKERVLAGAGAPVADGVTVPRRGSLAGWLFPVAAAVALVAFGIAGFQARRLDRLERTVASQAEALRAAQGLAERMAELEARNADLRETVAMLTSAGVEFCPLRPPEGSPAQAAWGAMAMSEEGGHWYLRIVGLEPRSDQMEYRLWFLYDGEPMMDRKLPMDAGDDAVEIMNGEAPRLFNSVLITLEEPGSDRPSGPRLLFGNERMQIL